LYTGRRVVVVVFDHGVCLGFLGLIGFFWVSLLLLDCWNVVGAKSFEIVFGGKGKEKGVFQHVETDVLVFVENVQCVFHGHLDDANFGMNRQFVSFLGQQVHGIVQNPAIVVGVLDFAKDDQHEFVFVVWETEFTQGAVVSDIFGVNVVDFGIMNFGLNERLNHNIFGGEYIL